VVAVEHASPRDFLSGEPLPLAARLAGEPESVHLYYRRLNQAEAWQELEMRREGGGSWQAAVPADYTRSPYPFSTTSRCGTRMASPSGRAFGPDYARQPYLVVRRRA
jgi:hypothetical protein